MPASKHDDLSSHKQFNLKCDVVVLGAGVVGISTAYALARRGLDVILVDREGGPARGTSFANGAQLSYDYSDTMGSPAMLRKLPGLILGADPLFRLKFRADPAFLRWGLAFLRNSTAKHQRGGTLSTLQLALESRLAMHALLERHEIAFGHAMPGKMHLYFDAASLKSAAETVELKRPAGAVQHVLSSAEACRIEPALGDAKGLEGVVYSPNDEVGDPYLFSVELTRILIAHYGVRTCFGMTAHHMKLDADGVTVTGANGEQIDARAVVVALGIGAPAFLRRHGIRTMIEPLKGYSFTAPRGAAAPRVSLTDTARKLVFCDLMGHMRIAGGAELGNWDTRLEPDRLTQLVHRARQSLPQAADFERLDSSWAGLRPMSPDSIPVIVRARPQLILNIGHGMLGWTLAMGAGEQAAALVLEELPSVAPRRKIA